MVLQQNPFISFSVWMDSTPKFHQIFLFIQFFLPKSIIFLYREQYNSTATNASCLLGRCMYIGETTLYCFQFYSAASINSSLMTDSAGPAAIVYTDGLTEYAIIMIKCRLMVGCWEGELFFAWKWLYLVNISEFIHHPKFTKKQPHNSWITHIPFPIT